MQVGTWYILKVKYAAINPENFISAAFYFQQADNVAIRLLWGLYSQSPFWVKLLVMVYDLPAFFYCFFCFHKLVEKSTIYVFECVIFILILKPGKF